MVNGWFGEMAPHFHPGFKCTHSLGFPALAADKSCGRNFHKNNIPNLERHRNCLVSYHELYIFLTYDLSHLRRNMSFRFLVFSSLIARVSQHKTGLFHHICRLLVSPHWKQLEVLFPLNHCCRQEKCYFLETNGKIQMILKSSFLRANRWKPFGVQRGSVLNSHRSCLFPFLETRLKFDSSPFQHTLQDDGFAKSGSNSWLWPRRAVTSNLIDIYISSDLVDSES